MGSLRNISLKSENCHFHISTTIQKCSQKTIKHWSHVYHTNTYLDAPRTCSWYGQATNSLLPTQPNRIFSGLMVISDGVFDVQTKLLLPPVGIAKSSVTSDHTISYYCLNSLSSIAKIPLGTAVPYIV